MTDLLAKTLGPWTYGDFLTAILIIFVGIVVRFIITSFVARKIEMLTSKTESEADDIAAKGIISPLGNIAIIIAIYFALQTLAADYPELLAQSGKIFKAIITVIVAGVVFKLIDAISLFFINLASNNESSFDDQIIPLLRKTVKTFVGVMTFVVALQNLGYSVTGMIAGLGIGGLAFALAAKDTIANLFGSVTILIDRPFKVGDMINSGAISGTVEEIGLRSTRIRTFEKTVVSIPNAEMANATVENTSERPRRKVTMQIGLTYDTSTSQIKSVIKGIEELLANHSGIDEDGQNVRFVNFGESTLDVEFKYFTLATGYNDHSLVKQEIGLAIMELLEGLKVEMAFPTRTLVMEKE